MQVDGNRREDEKLRGRKERKRETQGNGEEKRGETESVERRGNFLLYIIRRNIKGIPLKIIPAIVAVLLWTIILK